MARRNQRPGQWLATDDYFGFTRYGSQLKQDYWGAYAEKPLIRNLQEISSPLDDPQPVPFYRGPNYENTQTGINYDLAPTYVGLTNVPTSLQSMAGQYFNVQQPNPPVQNGVGFWSIGSTFKVS